MLSKLVIKFKRSADLVNILMNKDIYPSDLGVKLQGVLMSLISSEYAEVLHTTGGKFNECRPYSQYCYFDYDSETLTWVVSTTNEEAKRNIIDVLSTIERISFETVVYRNRTGERVKLTLDVSDINRKTTTLQEIIDKRYLEEEEDDSNLIKFKFVSPVIFTRIHNGEFIYLPDAYLMFKNLLDRYSAMSKDFTVNTEETLAYLKTSVKILDFNIKTVRVANSDCKVPACTGTVNVRFEATKEYGTFLKILAELSEYTGIGLQTARGLGGISVEIPKRKGNNRVRR